MPQPLQGRRVVVTRAMHQADELARPLRELGAEVLLLPTIGIAPPLNPAPLRAAAAGCDAYDWIIFTSVNAIESFISQLLPHGPRCRASIATVGAATREAAERHGFTVTLTPEDYVAESLVDAFHAHDLQHRRVLIPSAAVTRDVVATELRNHGAEVTVVEAYRNVIPEDASEQASRVFELPLPDWIVFASSSAASNLFQLVASDTLRPIKIATIGPVTSQTVRHHGLTVAVEAPVHTVPGLIAALVHYETVAMKAR